MNTHTPLALVIVLLGVYLQAQQPVFGQKPDSAQEPPEASQPASPLLPDSAQPREIERWIDAKQTPERIKRLVSLGVDKKTAESFTSEDDHEFKNFKKC
jgi:hypothetical protein